MEILITEEGCKLELSRKHLEWLLEMPHHMEFEFYYDEVRNQMQVTEISDDPVPLPVRGRMQDQAGMAPEPTEKDHWTDLVRISEDIRKLYDIINGGPLGSLGLKLSIRKGV